MLILAIKRIKEEGLWMLIKIHIRKALGLERQEDEINTLFYFLNNYVDIKKLPPSCDKNALQLQRCLTALLRVFHALCRKHELIYWMDYGTLLGAVRHGGFVPWDDDIDVAMPREDYEQLEERIGDELQQYGLRISRGNFFPGMMIEYRRAETGLFMDIFPVYEYKTKGIYDEVKDDLIAAARKCRKYYRNQWKRNYARIEAHREAQFGKVEKGDNSMWVHSPEFNYSKYLVHPGEEVIPIQELQFGEFSFCAPHDADAYLKKLYGNSYMGFPRTGVEHHPDKSGVLAKNVADMHGIDMNEVYNYLMNVANIIEKGNGQKT